MLDLRGVPAKLRQIFLLARRSKSALRFLFPLASVADQIR